MTCCIFPDFGERICKVIGRRRPELYLMDKHDLDITSNAVLLTDPGYRHVSHLIASDTSHASHASANYSSPKTGDTSAA
jgi:hypothetical protein